MPLRFEAWTLPETTPFERKFPIRDVLDYELRLGARGRGTLILPQEHPRLDDILYVDPTNHANDQGSLIRAYEGEELVGEFYAQRLEEAFTDLKKLVKITGDDITRRAMEKVRAQFYDYPTEPSVDRDWIYGGENSYLKNESFEDQSDGVENGDFETGDTTGWSAITGADTNPLQTNVVPDGFEVTDLDPFEGTYHARVDPTRRHSGIQQTVPVLPDSRITIRAKFKEPTGSGRRYTMLARPTSGSILHTPASEGAFTWNGDYLVELDGTPQNPAHNGLPGGSSDGTWQDFTLEMTTGDEQEELLIGFQYDQHDGSGGPIFYLDAVTIEGVGVGLDPWEVVGNLSKFAVDSTKVYDGQNSAVIRAQNSTPNVNGIRQIITNLTPGKTYTSVIWVYHEDGAARDFQLIYKLPAGAWAASNTETVQPGVWTKIELTAQLDVEEIWWDFRVAGTHSPFDFWVDNCSMADGLASATFGEITNDLLDDAGVDHVAEGRTALTWLTRTFSDLLDSSSALWDEDRSVVVKRGQPYRRFFDFMARSFGYEWRIRTNPADELEHFLDLYNAGNMGSVLDQEGDPAILRPSATGPLVRREPGANYALAEGDEGAWGEIRDAVLEGAWGPSEEYTGTKERLEGSLADVAIQALEDAESKAQGLKVTLEEPAAIPGVAYGIGDTVNVVLGDDRWPKLGYRVAAITIKHVGPGRDKYQVDLGSLTYSNPTGSGQAEAVARLLEAFEGLLDLPDLEGLAAGAAGPAPVIPDAMLAPSNARAEVYAIADFKASGQNDEDELRAALEFVGALDTDGGRLVLAGGELLMAADEKPIAIEFPNNVALQGMGSRQSKIMYPDSSIFDFTLVMASSCQLRHVSIEELFCGG